MTLDQLTSPAGIPCACGKVHRCTVDKVLCRPGAMDEVPEIVRSYTQGKVFVLCDPNTYSAAGERLCGVLDKADIGYSLYVLSSPHPAPAEETVGSALMHFDFGAKMIIAVGSGVVNDTAKLLAAASGRPYCIVATAPSMDGYASATSSMERDGLKVSLASACPNVIVGDTDVLRAAPEAMLRSGLGDMLAKYVSICEWRIAQRVTGEYYCEFVAELVRSALEKCVSNAQGLLKREPGAVEAVFEGLVIGGLAMTFAGLSRPASGVEHYFSHVWDMRTLEFGTPGESHGIQCALGTLLSVRMYEKLATLTPDTAQAIAHAADFDTGANFAMLRELLGHGAEAMIAQEAREKKYDPTLHRERLGRIVENWDYIRSVIAEELPSSAELCQLMKSVGLPTDPAELGLDGDLDKVFLATKDIRDKYVLSRLVWDLGLDLLPQ